MNRRSLLAVATAGVIVAGAIATIAAVQVDQQRRGFPSIYAYSEEVKPVIHIAEREKTIATLPGQYPVVSPSGGYVLSENGQDLYLFDVQSHRTYSHQLVYQAVSGCVPAALSDSYLYVADPRLVVYELPGFANPQDVGRHLPSGPTCPVGHVGDTALVLVDTARGWILYSVQNDGDTRRIGPSPLVPGDADLADTDFATTAGAYGSGDPELAYTSFGNAAYEVHVLDIRTGKEFAVSSSGLGLPVRGPRKADTVYLEDIWWSAAGHLYATMSSYQPSPPNQEPEQYSVQQVWILRGHSWTPEDIDEVVDLRPLSDGSGLVILPYISYLQFPGAYWGALYSYARKSLRLLGKEIYSVATPSLYTQDPVGLSAGLTPTLGQLVGMFKNGRGFGTVRPAEISNGGDPTGTVTDIHWKSWGGPTARGVGESDFVDPNESVASGKQEPVTVVAFDRGICGIHYMYMRVEWYFQQEGQSFAPGQYEDICIGTYPGMVPP
jgi:hypothetical protein